MQFEEQATGIAENGANFIASPEWCRACGAILTCWL